MQQDRIKPFLFYTGFFLCLLVWGFVLLRWLIPATLPFWLGLLIAFLLRPLTLKISGKLHLRRRKAAVFATILFYSVLGVALWLLLSLVWGQLCALTANVPELYKTFRHWHTFSNGFPIFYPDLCRTSPEPFSCGCRALLKPPQDFPPTFLPGCWRSVLRWRQNSPCGF